MTSPPAASRTESAPREALGPLIRGLTVLRALAAAGGRRPVSEVARSAGLARATVDRVLSTLEHIGHLRLEGRDAVLAPRLMELGNAYLASSRLPDELGPLADALADELDESVSIAVPDLDGVRFVHQAARRRAMSLTFRIGDLLPAERVAAGALFAADWTEEDWERWRLRREADPLDTGFPVVRPGYGTAHVSFADRAADARRRGWTVDDQMIEPGLVAVAVPVRNPSGRQVCGVGVVSHTSRHSAASLADAVLPRLRKTVADMADALAAPPPAAPPVGEPPAPRLRASKREIGPEFVQSLARGLSVLTALGHGYDGLPLSAVAEATGLPRATARRSLITLEHLGYVVGDGRLFRLTPRVLELGFAPLSGLTLPQMALPHLEALVGRVHESASMCVLSGDEIQYVARVPTVRIMSVNITVGTRFPAHATSMGRVLLAGLPEAERSERLARLEPTPLTRHTVTSRERLAEILAEVDRQGYSQVEDELEEGLRSIAAPVRDVDGRVIAAVNVSTHSGRAPAERSRAELLPPLLEAAAALEADLRVAGRYVRIATA